MHLRKLPSGAWQAAIRHGGERRSVSARTRHEAQRLAAEALIEMGASGRKVDRTMTVGSVIGAAMAAGSRRWSPTYFADADRVVSALPERFADRLALDVTPSVIVALYAELGRQGWSAHRVKRLHAVMSKAWADAIPLGWVRSNPFRDVSPPTPAPRHVVAPGDEQVRAILAAIRTPQEALALRLAATLGLRRGELVGIQWADVSLDRAELVVRRSLVWTSATGLVERPTKTGPKGQRVLALDLPTVALLRSERAAQLEAAMARGTSPMWVLSDSAGSDPWLPGRVTKMFGRVRKAASVSGVRLHDLRHYVATSMLQDGEAVIDVAAQLGHASMTTTASVYAHYLPGRGRESVERRAQRLG